MFRFFENLIDPFRDHPEQNSPPTRVWPYMRDILKPFSWVIIYASILAVVVAAIEVGLVWYLGRLVNLLSESTVTEFWASYSVELIIVAVFMAFLRPILVVVDTLLLNNTILPGVQVMFRFRAHKHILKQSVGWFENDFAGRISNRVMQAPTAASEVVFQVFDALAFASAYLIGAVIMLAAADIRLAIPLFVWGIAYSALVIWTVRRVTPASEASSDARSALTGRIVDSYTNIHTVKMFSHHESELTYAKEAMEDTRKTLNRELRVYSIMEMVLTTINGFLILGLVGYALYLWSYGLTGVGMVAVATALSLRMNSMMSWIMWALTTFFRELGVVREGLQTITSPVDLCDPEHPVSLDPNDTEIEIADLSHHYGQKSGGLNNINLSIKPGEKIALVGQSGAGKSTLVKLLLRFYDAESGHIKIGGREIQNLAQNDVRQRFGVVQQDSSLLHRSIRDNIRYGHPNANEEQVILAAKKAEAWEFIQDLKDSEGNAGLDAKVGERGVKLSGGQRQRIALARVILKDAPYLILDEATSALDSVVEAQIQKTLYQVMGDKSVIAIAHRLSTIAQMDRIIVLENGSIIEQGSHEELIALKGAYAGFWKRQSGGFLKLEDEA